MWGLIGDMLEKDGRTIKKILYNDVVVLDLKQIPIKNNNYDWNGSIGKIIECRWRDSYFPLHIYDKDKTHLHIRLIGDLFNEDIVFRIKPGNLTQCKVGSIIKNIYANKKYNWMIPIIGEENARVYTYSSTKTVECRCPSCGNIYQEAIQYIYSKHQLDCALCSDGISYPEKVFANLLTLSNIEFHRQFYIKEHRVRYDFYIPSLKTIVETHGIQHYEKGSFYGDEEYLIAQKEKDKLKKEIALQLFPIDNYIELDCRYSDINFIMSKIKETELANHIKWETIDLDYINKNSHKSLMIEVCNKRKEDNLSVQELMGLFNLSKSCVTKWLKVGNEHGWCVYEPKIEMSNGGKKSSRMVRGVNQTTGEVVEFYSAREASRQLKCHHSTITACLKRSSRFALGYRWEYID